MAQAVPVPTLSTFVTQLLAPIAIASTDRQTRAQARRDLEDAWSVAYHRYYATRALEEYHSHLARIAEVERKSLKVPERDEVSRTFLARIAAADRLMMIPAPNKPALTMKRKMRTFNGGRDRWEAAIAADEERLK